MKTEGKAQARTGTGQILSAPLLYILPSHEYMAEGLKKIPELVVGTYTLARFPNDELYLTVDSRATRQSCLVLGSIAPPETTLVSFLLLCHTLKEEGAQKITAVLPYLAYSRHDKKEPRKSRATALIGALLSSAGVDEVITVDVHSLQTEQLFPIPLVSLSPAKIFANEIAQLSLQSATIVAPDEGAIDRCEAVAKEAGVKREIVYLTKERTKTGVTHHELHGTVGAQVVIVDDMLDTGSTLISCCEKLLEKGAQEIYVIVTHGLFTGTAWKKLWDLGVKQIYCTDSLPIPKKVRRANVTVLSIIPLLVDRLKGKW